MAVHRLCICSGQSAAIAGRIPALKPIQAGRHSAHELLCSFPFLGPPLGKPPISHTVCFTLGRTRHEHTSPRRLGHSITSPDTIAMPRAFCVATAVRHSMRLVLGKCSGSKRETSAKAPRGRKLIVMSLSEKIFPSEDSSFKRFFFTVRVSVRAGVRVFVRRLKPLPSAWYPLARGLLFSISQTRMSRCKKRAGGVRDSRQHVQAFGLGGESLLLVEAEEVQAAKFQCSGYMP